ncbi:hypothetical protein H0G86_012893 [Trichoderma simmonsii]|uniref:Uncharacterized protein n=1 Tax=Trichoderma simmonsii TaxID=1491479 RepID=A0A8G0LPD7_9HYPO|nr:hypothetical protein Trihar35433_7481 [Trichoderma harzianum]QYT06028.1 hypothetical protein H0G86_012893 [Trichoderma simmonsii]
MDAAVQGPASPGNASLGDPISTGSMDGSADVSLVTFAAAASSHEDEDFKESDRWRLHSDTSTISSRVTTPDPVVSSPPLTPFASAGSRTPLPGRISNVFSPLPLLPPAFPPRRGTERGRGRGRGGARGASRLLPRSPNEAARSHQPNPAESSRYGPIRPLLPTSSAGMAQPLSPFPLLVEQDRGDDSHRSRRLGVPPHPPPPPPPPLNSPPLTSSSYFSNLPTMSRPDLSLANNNYAPPPSSQASVSTQQLIQSAPGFSINNYVRPRPSRGKRNSGRSYRRRSNGPEDEALTFSLTRLEDDETWSSSSSSNEDPIAYRNARQFPPQLPAGPSYGPSAPRSRSSAANQITAWVSQYEKSRSPTRSRSRLGDISAVLHPTDTESHLDGSLHSNDSSHGEIEMLWQQLKEKRAKLSGTRAEMRSRRKALRQKRREKDAADNAFMSVVRPVLISRGEIFQATPSLFESRLEKMQQLRDDYQVLESSYETLEAMLDEEERDLSILETRFFSILAAGQTKEERQLDVSSDSGAANFNIDQVEIPYELRGISPFGPVEDPHPLYVDLTSTVGYLGNARDEYADLLSTKEQYEEEQLLKKTTNQKTPDELDVKEFFDEFPSEEERMVGVITNLESQVSRLRKICEDRGIMKKHMSVKMEYALDPQIKYEDLDLDDEQTILSSRKTLGHTEFNELLSQPDHVLADEPLTPLGALKAAIRLPNHHPEKGVKKRLASKEYAIDNLMRECDGGKKADYVNRWLLHQLRLSPLNAVLLRSTFQASRSLKIRDMWRWQCDVMHYWWRDNTMSLTDGFFKPITSDNSEYSTRQGSPQLSRAASDGGPRHVYQQHEPIDNSDAMTEYGESFQMSSLL